MKKTLEVPTSLYVTITDQKIVTSIGDTMGKKGYTILKSRKDWELLQQQYEDMAIDRGMQFFPELNSYFSFLLTLLIDENDVPQNIEIILNTSMLKKKGNL